MAHQGNHLKNRNEETMTSGKKIDPEAVQSILATDCGSTTTKAILIERQNGEYRLVARGEAPTTVEAPVEDVIQGVRNSILEVQEIRGRPLIEKGEILKPQSGNQGVDLYLSTSSAGGGLQMMVAGVVREISAESASRAALGAGAIVMDVVATNDGRLPHQRIEQIRELRPDMILLSGGVDGGTISHVVDVAQIISASEPRPRLGFGFKLPVIFAGNKEARGEVKKILGDKVALEITDNLRPSDKTENLGPARQSIQTLFLEHVMAHAPGYKNLMNRTDVEIMPTPAAVGLIMQRIAERYGNILGVDIGGATTDVFSVFNGIFNRTVSANLGMSYSISNVFLEAGLENILRWIPFDLSERDLKNRIKNKMIRPTTIPQTIAELVIEQAICREALRLSFEQHKLLAVGLKGVQQERTIADAFTQTGSGKSLVNLMDLNMIIGSGGVLSHAPRRVQAALMMMDAYLPEGVTCLTVDSIFMMPQLGVLSQVHPDAATGVFEKDCLVWLGTCISPVGKAKEGQVVLHAEVIFADGKKEEMRIRQGDLAVISLGAGEKAQVRLQPSRGIDAGKGKGESWETVARGGSVGLIFDARGRRPFNLPKERTQQKEKLAEWNKALKVYP